MADTHRISKRLKMLGGAAVAAALMAASAQAATVFDITSGLGAEGGLTLLQTLGRHAVLPQPATMMIVGTVLLAAFRARPHA